MFQNIQNEGKWHLLQNIQNGGEWILYESLYFTIFTILYRMCFKIFKMEENGFCMIVYNFSEYCIKAA